MANERTDRRLELRGLNVRAATEDNVFPVLPKTDSSLKKNTSFVKKLRAINQDNVQQILADVRSLSLEKYLSEICVSLVEPLINSARSDDIVPYLEVVSALYQRFKGAIQGPILSSLVNFFLVRNGSEPLPRHTFVLKFVFNMCLTSLCETFADCDAELLSDTAAKLAKSHELQCIIIPLLKSIMAFEPKSGHSLAVVSSFARTFKDIIRSSDGRMLSVELHTTLRQLLTFYTNEIVKLLAQARKNTLVRKERLTKASIRTGKLLEDLQGDVDAAEDLERAFESGAKLLCDAVDVEFPEKAVALPSDEQTTTESNGQTAQPEWWEDSLDCEFHTVIPSEEEVSASVEASALNELELDNLPEGNRVLKFLALLENVASEKDILLCSVVVKKYVPYNKATKNKLLKFFSFEAKKKDNVNLYARFLKINEAFLADVISELTADLDHGFRSQIYHGRINFRTISFFVELVKFKLIPKHIVFHKIRKLTLDLAGTNNTAILLIFYQDCGKFLLFEPEYLETTREMLELLQLRAKSASLSLDEKHAVRNVFTIIDSYTNPKPPLLQQAVSVSPIQDYVDQILKVLATPAGIKKARVLFQEIDFCNDVEAQEALLHTFRKPEELNSDNYGLVALLLVSGGKKRKFLVARIVNDLVEQVYRGLENNDYRYNATRTAQVRLLAAFFNERIISIRTVIDLLFRIVCFGHTNNLPVPNSTCDLDRPNDYFRLALCCSVLGPLDFELVKKTDQFSGSVKSIEGFLTFLQYYSYCKIHPLPKEIVFMLSAVFLKFEDVIKESFDTANNFTDAAAIFQAYTIKCSSVIAHSSEDINDIPLKPETDAQLDDQDEYESSNESGSDSESESDTEESAEEDADEEIEDCTSESDDEESEDSSDGEMYNEDLDEEEEEKRIEKRMETLRLEQEKRFLSAMDRSIQELRRDVSQSGRSGSLRMPMPSTLKAIPTVPGTGMKLNFLTKSNQLKKMDMPSSKLLEQRIMKEQEERKANQKKILSLVDQMT